MAGRPHPHGPERPGRQARVDGAGCLFVSARHVLSLDAAFPALCPKPAGAPTVLAVGDLHVENYGTWRDAEGRLVWGINDFDEAFPLPYTLDLVRLATSAWLAIELGHLSLVPANACAAILEGYTKGLENGGEPFVLAEKHPLLREAVTSRLRDPVLFWEKFAALPTVKPVPAQGHAVAQTGHAGTRPDFSCGAPAGGAGEPGPGTVHRHGRLARRQNRARNQAVAAVGLCLGGWIVRTRRFTISGSWPTPSARRIRSWRCKRDGSCGGCRPIAAGLNCRSCRAAMMKKSCCGRWDGNWPMSISARAGAVAAVRRDLRAAESRNGCAQAAEVMAEATLKDWKEWRKGTR